MNDVAQLKFETVSNLDFDYASISYEDGLALRRSAEEVRTLVKRTAENIVSVGRHLSDAKKRLARGYWLPWLKKEFSWTDRTAENYIRVFEWYRRAEAKIEAELLQSFDITAIYELSGRLTPAAVTDKAIEKAKASVHVTKAVVKDLKSKAPPRVIEAVILPPESEVVSSPETPDVKLTGPAAADGLPPVPAPLELPPRGEDEEASLDSLIERRDAIRIWIETAKVKLQQASLTEEILNKRIEHLMRGTSPEVRKEEEKAA